ncbi:MAG: hypothetical protein ACR2H3_03355, partial [Acidimicrobiales bacterium]
MAAAASHNDATSPHDDAASDVASDVASQDDNAPVDLQAVLAQWRVEADLEDAIGDLGDPFDWISLAEAEEAAGVSRSTLRAWYRGGHVPSRLVPGPHGVQRMVPREIVVERAQRSPGIGRRVVTQKSEASVSAGAANETTTGGDVAQSMLRMAELACEQAEARAAAAEARADAAEGRAAAAETDLRAALQRAAAA